MLNEAGRLSRTMTVAQIREPEGRDYCEVVFLESARFYRLLRANPAFGEIIGTLRKAMGMGRPVRVVLATVNGDMIQDVQMDVPNT
jgi:hypothetical protein